MQEKNTNVPNEKKPGEGQQWPETGKQGGQTDIGKKGGDIGKTGDLGKTGDVNKP
ncbi:MAG TPA: hypothetical protein VFM06_03925 [Candidatus Limnocylindria bacterium]|nr:hypothetical protein [Candidatus Limnocylindria bacterium]